MNYDCNMKSVKNYIYVIKKYVSKAQVYISFLFFAIAYVNDLRAEVVFQAGKDQYFDPRSVVELESKNFQPVLEPKTEFECSLGYKHNLKEFRGNFVIAYFWATWCNQCVERLKTLYALKEELEYQNIDDVKILPISVDFKDIKSIESYLASNKLEGSVFFRDNSKQLMSDFGINNVPIAVLIDKKGYVVNKLSGDINWNSKDIIRKVLAMKGTDPVVITEPSQEGEKVGDPLEQSDIISTKQPLIIN